VFGKRLDNVLRDIRNLFFSEEFHVLNFELMLEMKILTQEGAYKTEYYIVKKDGF